MKDYKFFTSDELKCKCGKCDGGEMDESFMWRLEGLRERCSFPFIVTSGYRCPAYNQAVGGAKDSAHMEGKAVDINVYGERAAVLNGLAYSYGFMGMGLSQTGPYSERIIHLDTALSTTWRTRPTIWTY